MLKPIRVLHVFAEMNRGGAETMVMNLYRNIDRSKVQFDFIVHTEDKCSYDEEIKSLGGHIIRIPPYMGKNHISYRNKWKEIFEKLPQYKIIHGHVRSTASIYLSIAKKYGLITIAHSHNTSSGRGFSSIVKNILQYPIRYISDYFFACSKSAGEWLFGKKVVNQDDFNILNNAINVKEFSYNPLIRKRIREEFQIENKFVIGNVGRFHPQKNQGYLIDIFKAVHSQNKNTILMLVGDGTLKEQLKKKVNNLGLANNVIFTGVRSNVAELFQAMDVFAFPSIYEGLGIVAIEAQASGLPCIITDTLPTEIFITRLVEPVSLRQPPVEWAKLILKYNNEFERIINYKKIKDSGYDIEETSVWLQEFYLGLVK